MTFTEAAAQVLRLVGKPLHYKEITDVAIEKNLLSHVGKSPDVTMGARLAALVKKGDKENPLVRVRPGVFALREWDQAMIEKGLQDRTPALEKLAGQEVNFADIALERKSGADNSSPSGAPGEDEEEALAAPSEEERVRADLAAHGSELFASEDDDDLPIFGAGSAAPAPVVAVDDGGDRGRGRGRRRGRGRGRGGEERGGDDLPAYTVSDAPAELPPEVAQEVEARVQERDERTADERFDNEQPEPRPQERTGQSERLARDGRGRDRDRGADRDRGGDRDRSDRDRGDRDRGAAERGAVERGGAERSTASLDDVVGKDLADAVESIVAGFDRNRGPVAVQTLVDAAARRGRYAGELSVGQGLLLGAARADNLRRAAEGKRPRFRVSGSRLALTEWQMDPELLRIERDMTSLVERYREVSRRSLLRLLQDLPQRGLGELVLLLLEHCGFTELTSVRRQGSHGAEMHFSGKLKSASSEVRTAIVVRRDGREVGRERVTELRGALHHYGPAHAGWIITTGQVLSGAREEAAAPGASPVSVIDGAGLAKLCEEHEIGLMATRILLPHPDLDLLDALRG